MRSTVRSRCAAAADDLYICTCMAAICWISSESMIQSRSATDCVNIQPTFRSLRRRQQSVEGCRQEEHIRCSEQHVMLDDVLVGP